MTYRVNSDFAKHEDGIFYTAKDGKGYFESRNLHIISGAYHFIGKTDGFYLISMASRKECYLKNGVITIDCDDLTITDKTTFGDVMTELAEEEENA